MTPRHMIQKALCHCADCRKISGSAYSTNLFVDVAALNLVAGSPKLYSKPTDAGNTITSYFCGDCGGTLWRQSSGYPVRSSFCFGSTGAADLSLGGVY